VPLACAHSLTYNQCRLLMTPEGNLFDMDEPDASHSTPFMVTTTKDPSINARWLDFHNNSDVEVKKKNLVTLVVLTRSSHTPLP
jgi:hypothetical protein